MELQRDLENEKSYNEHVATSYKAHTLAVLQRQNEGDQPAGAESVNTSFLHDPEYLSQKNKWMQMEQEAEELKANIRTALVPTDPLGAQPMPDRVTGTPYYPHKLRDQMIYSPEVYKKFADEKEPQPAPAATTINDRAETTAARVPPRETVAVPVQAVTRGEEQKKPQPTSAETRLKQEEDAYLQEANDEFKEEEPQEFVVESKAGPAQVESSKPKTAAPVEVMQPKEKATEPKKFMEGKQEQPAPAKKAEAKKQGGDDDILEVS